MKTQKTKSAFERLPAEYRDTCKQVAGKGRSPQNRRVREAVDLHYARMGDGRLNLMLRGKNAR